MKSNEEIVKEAAQDCAEWVKDRVRKALELKDIEMEKTE